MLHQIGVGALGPVFRTYEPTRDRLVAVKVFRLDLTPEQASSLADELSRATQAGLFHPSIVEPVAAGLEGTVAYRAEEYVAAESLDVAMRHYAPATLDKALPFITQLASAIDFARAAGVGHGALHPRDIFVTPDEARATGFGVVDALERLGQRAPVRRPYSPPERIEGRAWSTPADVFSLGVIAFELLTGRRPAGVGDQMGTLAGASLGDSAEAVRGVLARAMAEAPEDRYVSAVGFASALAEAAGSPELASALLAAVSLPQSRIAGDELSGTPTAEEEAADAAAAEALLVDSGESPREAARKAIAARKRQMKDAPPTIETPAPVIAEAPLSVTAAIEPGAAVDLEPAAALESEPAAVVEAEPAAAVVAESAAAVDLEPVAAAEPPAAEVVEVAEVVEPASVTAPEPLLPPVEPFKSEKTFAPAPKPKTREHRSRKVERREGEQALPLAAKADTPAPDSAGKSDSVAETLNVRELTSEAEPAAIAGAALGAAPDLPLAPPPPLPIAAAIDDLGTVTGAAAGASAADALLTLAASRPSPADDDAPATEATDRAASETPLLRDVSDRVVAVDEFRARDSAAPRTDRNWPRLSDRPPAERSLASNPSPIEPSERPEPVLPAGARESDDLRRDRSGLAMLPLAVMLIVGLLIGYMIRDFIGERDRREAPAVTAGVQPAAAPAGGQPPATDATDQAVAPSATTEPKPPAPAPVAPVTAAKPNAAAPKTGSIIVSSTPSKAAVTVNGRWSGRTPLRLNDRPFGKYSVRVVLEGYEVARQNFALSASSATRTIDVDLKRVPSSAKPAAAKPAAAAQSGPAATTGDVFVDSRPQGARVLIDGREVGVTPFRVPGVTPGTYAVRLELADHNPWTATAKVVAGETARVTGSLDRIR